MSGGTPEGFSYEQHQGGEIVIHHHRRLAATLRDDVAARFLEELEAGEAQEVMARYTGNYRRGNERTAKLHPRNR